MKFQGSYIKHNNECLHIHLNPMSEIYENFRNLEEISEKFRVNFREILMKFQGSYIKHNNECLHIHLNPMSEIYENFGNFKEISEKFRVNFRETSLNTIISVYIPILTLSVKYMEILEI